MRPPDSWEIPERAILAFETLTGLRLTVHDLTVPLWPYLPPERFKHHAPCCLAVKATHDWACVDFEVTRLRTDILRHPEGRCHQCHAGFLEWAVPAFIDGRLAWIFFAGPARAGGVHRELVRDLRTTAFPGRKKTALPVVPEKRSAVVLEALRQLRSRLLAWHASLHPRGRAAPRSPGKDRASRGHAIRNFLFERHTADPTVGGLARYLGLGESRTIHLVRELFGCGFSELVNQMRLKTAASLLRNSALPVQEVCYASGFRDLSHFHRTFRRHFRLTPLRYRKTAGS